MLSGAHMAVGVVIRLQSPRQPHHFLRPHGGWMGAVCGQQLIGQLGLATGRSCH